MKSSCGSSSNDPVTTSRQPSPFYRLLWLVAIAVALGGAYWFYTLKTSRPPDPPGVQSIVPPEKVESFKLTDQHGKPFTQADLLGKWTIMLFGYTHCPDFCPTTLAGLNNAYHRLEREAPRLAATTRVVFVSVDPYRDTQPVLGAFVAHFNQTFIGLSGSIKQLHRLTDPLGASFDYSDPVSRAIFPDTARPAQKDYVVDHSSGIYIFDDKARAAAWILPPHSAARIVSVYQLIRREND